MAPDTARARRWALRGDPRSAIRTAVVWEVLDTLVAEQSQAVGRASLDVVDVGGGTGGFAVPLAELGHRVTVVDPSPDALAALRRRAADAGVADRVRAEQGDAGALTSVLGAGVADVVLCHGALEYVDDPHAALHDAVDALRPDGLLSVLVAQRLGALFARALSGRFAEARRILDDPAGRGGDGDPVPRRFDEAALRGLLADRPAATGDGSGGGSVEVRLVHGVRIFTDLLPGALVDGDPEAAQALLDLERAASEHPDRAVLSAVAAQLHLVARRRG
ncbi:bifunctional 2-polyprenyl-6-hydroxyphenol methylase/3-demethylubiquinol 3-O-methyltransferase UbiG [Kineosporia sp. R_H_3]|uniref:class I SAM-dependent methyltransferase n=1 Tax=Kineosporia sp. R_H_3 TaxID=1961848 RepID=UPI001E55B5F2|nr:methyltransferase [Kineosporia sp. R_H_3]